MSLKWYDYSLDVYSLDSEKNNKLRLIYIVIDDKEFLWYDILSQHMSKY